MCNWWSEQLLCYKQCTIILLHRPAIIHHSSLPLPPFKKLSRHFQVFQSCMPCNVSSLSLVFVLLHLLFFHPLLFLPLFPCCVYSHAVLLSVLHWCGPLNSGHNVWSQLQNYLVVIWLVRKRHKRNWHGYTQPHGTLYSNDVTQLSKDSEVGLYKSEPSFIITLYLGVNYHIDFPTQHRHVHIRNCTAGS